MKLLGYRRRENAGITLLETLVYLAVFAVILELAYEACFRSDSNLRHFSGVAGDILGTTRVGEQWREEIRHATGRVRSEIENGAEVFQIPGKEGEISYRFGDHALWRRSGSGEVWLKVLPSVEDCRFLQERVHGIDVWRCELRLTSRSAHPKVLPLFSFVVPLPASVSTSTSAAASASPSAVPLDAIARSSP